MGLDQRYCRLMDVLTKSTRQTTTCDFVMCTELQSFQCKWLHILLNILLHVLTLTGSRPKHNTLKNTETDTSCESVISGTFSRHLSLRFSDSNQAKVKTTSQHL